MKIDEATAAEREMKARAESILNLIISRKTGGLLKSFSYRQACIAAKVPTDNGLFKAGPERVLAAEAYWVWRNARFHGGADVTMPIMTELMLEKRPDGLLVKLSDLVAKQTFGTDMGATRAWKGLL